METWNDLTNNQKAAFILNAIAAFAILDLLLIKSCKNIRNFVIKKCELFAMLYGIGKYEHSSLHKLFYFIIFLFITVSAILMII